MKALSIKQPYAELILQSRKTIELRKWNANFRGEFLIHSSKTPDLNAMKKFGFNNLPCGFILGKVKLIEVKHYLDEEEHTKDRDKHLASNFFGNFGFVLKDIERTTPIAAKGNLNFWEFDFSKRNLII
ncbi:MAG: ASCH domain-containing protein [Nanoarchaeota archaeon]